MVHFFQNKRYISTKQKLLGSYLIILIIPVLLVGIYLTMSIRSNLITNKLEEIETNNERIRVDYSSILSSVTRVSDWIFQDEDLAVLVSTEYENPFQVYQAYARYQMFEDYLRYYDEINHIRFYVNNPTITSTTGIYHASEEITGQDWYRDAIDKQGRIFWIQLNDHVTGETHLNLVRAVYRDYQLTGVLAIAVSDAAVQTILTDSASTVFITLDNQTPLYSYPNYEDILHSFNMYKPILESVETTEGNYDLIDSDQYDEDFTLNIRDVDIPKTLESEMQVIGVVPTSTILSDVNRDLRMAYFIIASVFVISILLLNLFIRKFNDRIIKLKDAMTMVSYGDFGISTSIKGNDELSQVYDHLVLTVKSIEELMVENYEHVVKEKNWQLQLKEAQFKMLASQINPHFLYNTLEMIRMKALGNQDKEVAEIVKILSRLMRKSLEGNQKELVLSDELTFIEMYLQIQRLRFGEQIDFDIRQETTGNYTIIPLIIQPIVENSFIHGIEPLIGNGMIRINAEEDGENLRITIEDNGVGMNRAKLEKIRGILSSKEESEHLGIKNVHQRIQSFYGDQYGLTIDSKENQGTIVTINLPAIPHYSRKRELDNA